MVLVAYRRLFDHELGTGARDSIRWNMYDYLEGSTLPRVKLDTKGIGRLDALFEVSELHSRAWEVERRDVLSGADRRSATS